MTLPERALEGMMPMFAVHYVRRGEGRTACGRPLEGYSLAGHSTDHGRVIAVRRNTTGSRRDCHCRHCLDALAHGPAEFAEPVGYMIREAGGLAVNRKRARRLLEKLRFLELAAGVPSSLDTVHAFSREAVMEFWTPGCDTGTYSALGLWANVLIEWLLDLGLLTCDLEAGTVSLVAPEPATEPDLERPRMLGLEPTPYDPEGDTDPKVGRRASVVRWFVREALADLSTADLEAVNEQVGYLFGRFAASGDGPRPTLDEVKDALGVAREVVDVRGKPAMED